MLKVPSSPRTRRLGIQANVRVSPSEVEQILLDSGLFSEVAVFGLPHELSGQQVCAAVVPEAGIDDPRRALLRFARGELTAPMIPRRTWIVSELPRTHSGKVDYPALVRSAGVC